MQLQIMPQTKTKFQLPETICRYYKNNFSWI